MSTQTTFAIVKPDAVNRGLENEILEMARAAGLVVVAQRPETLSRQLVEALYAEHAGKEWFPLQVAYMMSGPVVVAALRGENAVATWRKLMGATDHTKAEASTIRQKFALSYRENSVHGSDSIENACRELGLVFGLPFVMECLVAGEPSKFEQARTTPSLRSWFVGRLMQAGGPETCRSSVEGIVEDAFQR